MIGSRRTGGREIRPEDVVVWAGGTYAERRFSWTTGGEAGRGTAGGTAAEDSEGSVEVCVETEGSSVVTAGTGGSDTLGTWKV